MSPAMVTLGYEEVEWISQNDELKAAIWEDEAFAAWVADTGLLVALHEVSLLHREIGNQLIRAQARNRDHSEWAVRAINLTMRLKKRRQQLRRAARAEIGDDAVRDTIRIFESRYPKAEWAA